MTGIFNKMKSFLALSFFVFILGKTASSHDLLAGKEECGTMATNDRIIQGSNSPLDGYPWTALLEYENLQDDSKKFLCSGSLIGPKHVITSAVCVRQTSTNNKLISVRLGEWDLKTEMDCVGEVEKDCSDPPVNIEVESSVAHPDFMNNKTRRNRFQNDIAIIKLAKEVKYSDFISPICLPDLDDVTKPNSILKAISWGKAPFVHKIHVKQVLNMKVFENSNCSTVYEKQNVYISDSQICAIGVDGKGTTNGDGGGPLMNRYKDNLDKWYLEGIVSFGPPYGTVGIPEVFTKVSSYLNWIHENVQ